MLPHSPIPLARSLCLILATATVGQASAPAEGTRSRADATAARLEAVLAAGRESLGARGAAAALILPDGSIWEGASGMAADGVPLEPHALFDAGSIAKLFTAALVLGLVDDGLVDLDAPVVRWLPQVPNASTVSPRMLLNHTSGWADVWDEPAFIPELAMQPARHWSMQEVLEATPAPVEAPGQGWEYSSSSYVALGLLAEKATGTGYGQLLRKRVLDPLGLERCFHGAYEVPEPPLAHGFLDVDGDGDEEDFTALLAPTSFRSAAGPAGALLATPLALARGLRGILEGQLHTAATLEQATRWVERPDGHQHGLGLLRIELGGMELVGHRGNAPGFSAAVWHAPGEQITMAVLVNRHGLLVTELVAELLGVATAP